MLTLIRRYKLHSSHQLCGGLPEGHKCRNRHGHTYKVTLYISGIPDEHGVLIEAADLNTVVWPVLRRADHADMNTLNARHTAPEARLVGENPTVERIAAWIGAALAGLVKSSRADGQRLRLVRVTVMETAGLGAEWTPE